MSPARCSMCHCFSRSCPVGLPNHKPVSAVGLHCTMNSLGRHFRNQDTPDNPSCDYELNGVKCTFFGSGTEFSDLPYPSDITTGRVADQVAPQAPQLATQQGDLSAILSFLQEQKIESEKTKNQMQMLQTQVSSLLTNRDSIPAPVPAYLTSSNPAPLPIVTSAPHTTAPHVVASAAAGLAADLQAGLGHANHGYSGLTMDRLRSDPAIVSQANAVLNASTQNVPPLNPLAGMGAALGTLRNEQVISVDALYAATTVNKQLRAFEFASTGQFPYKTQLKQDNTNAVTFAYGAIKHLEAVKSGLIKNMSDNEFLARLKHLRNVFEIACLSSTLTSFCDPSWQVAREYDARVIADIESGDKSWDTMSNGLETDAIYCAKETVELKNKAKKPAKVEKKVFEDKPKKDPKKNGCTTFNTHRASDGCFWEHTNKGDNCVFEHYCSWCKANRNVTEKHKAIHCEFKPE